MSQTMESEQNKARVVTLSDIAERCGVTKVTVSRALRDPERHSKALTQKIFAAAKEMGYDITLNQDAQKMAMRKYGHRVINHIIALLFPAHFTRTRYFSDMFEGIAEALSTEGFGILTISINNIDEKDLPAISRRVKVDGVLLYTGGPLIFDTITRLKSLISFKDLPIVSLLTPHLECSLISADVKKGMYDATVHLFQLGHRHIVYIKGKSDDLPLGPPNDQQLEGIIQAYHDNGLNPDTYLHTIPFGIEFWEMAFNPQMHIRMGAIETITRKVQHPIVNMLNDYPEITAIIAPNDMSANIIYHLMRSVKLNVPEDISLIGADDTDPIYDDDGENILTTLKMPLQHIGSSAATLIVEQINNVKYKKTEVCLPTQLVIRKTTGPAPKKRRMPVINIK
jgi:LacI family transcriptional regulator